MDSTACCPQKRGQEFDGGAETFDVADQILMYGERIAKGTLAGKNVCGGD